MLQVESLNLFFTSNLMWHHIYIYSLLVLTKNVDFAGVDKHFMQSGRLKKVITCVTNINDMNFI